MLGKIIYLCFIFPLIGYGQEDSIPSLRNESIARLLTENTSINLGQGNRLKTDLCDGILTGTDDYHIRTGYVGFDETASALGEWYSSPTWINTSTPGGCGVVNMPCVIRSYPYYWGDFDIDIDGDGINEGLQLLTPFACGGDLGYYRYETRFCLSSDATGPNIDLKVLADNNARIYLNGTLIGDQGIETVTGYYSASLLEVSSSDLLIGENVLEIEVANFSYINQFPGQNQMFTGPESFTGCAVYANVTTRTGCVTNCDQKGVITGHKFNDIDNNGSLDGWDTPMADIEIQLIESGVVIASTITNEEGFFYFLVEPGTYDVSEVSDLTNTYPGDGIHESITVEEYGGVLNLLFLNSEYEIIPCDGCENKFRPIQGENYWISAWIKVGENQVKSYYNEDGAFIRLVYIGGAGSPVMFYPSGEIIDGWQRIVGKFSIPEGVDDLIIDLNADPDNDTYFDDIRIHPFNGSMKSYVYDGETFWLTSELDDNNYATFYEYDEEGGLIRIKKETAHGIVTIQETGSNTKKIENTDD